MYLYIYNCNSIVLFLKIEIFTLLFFSLLFFIIIFFYLSEGFQKYGHLIVIRYFTSKIHPNYTLEPKVKILTRRELDAKNRRNEKDEEEEGEV